MALALLTGDQREDQAIAIGATVAAILTSAELALAAAISAAVYKAALGSRPSRKTVEQQLAVILAIASARALRAIAVGFHPVPPEADRAITAAADRAFAEAVSAYQQVAGLAAPKAGSVSIPAIQAAQAALDDLLGGGITGFTDRAGRKWDMTTYAEMATRTAISNAIDDQTALSLQQQGLDLVLVTHGSEPACDKCGPYIGKLLSLSGSTLPGSNPIEDAAGRFRSAQVVATLASAKAHGFRHPNCRCSLVPWSDGADLSASDTFVPPSPAALERRYAAEQAQRSAQRNARAAARRQRLAFTPQAKRSAWRDLVIARAISDHHKATARQGRHH